MPSPWRYYLKLYRGSYWQLAVSIFVSAARSLLFLSIAALRRAASDKVECPREILAGLRCSAG